MLLQVCFFFFLSLKTIANSLPFEVKTEELDFTLHTNDRRFSNND